MKAEIKGRIEQIKKGDVPEGYKKTRHGVIPKSWDVDKLANYYSKIRNGFVGTATPYYVVNGVKYLQGKNIKKGRIVRDDLIYVSEEFHVKQSKSALRINDIVMVQSGHVGECAVINDEFDNANCHALIVMSPKGNVDSHYYSYFFNSNYGERSFFKIKTGNTIQHILASDMKVINVPLPKLSEQQKIATILSTWDKAIELKEKLIEQKKEQKRGLMKVLLNGKVRLPGLVGEWKEIRIGDLLKQVIREEKWDDNKLYNLVSVRRRSDGLFHRDSLFGHQIATKTLVPIKEDDFLISKMQVVHGALGKVAKEFENYYVSGSYIILKPKDSEKLNVSFFNYLSNLPFMYRKALKSSYGVHIEKMTFNLKLYLREKIRIPSDINEQNRIVNVLDCLTKEINLLQQELQALKLQKKGLMQLLLTGIVRVNS